MNKRKHSKSKNMRQWYLMKRADAAIKKSRTDAFQDLIEQQAREYQPDFVDHKELREFIVSLCFLIVGLMVVFFAFVYIIEPLSMLALELIFKTLGA